MRANKNIPSESFYLAVGNIAHEGGYTMERNEALERCRRGVLRLGFTWSQIVSPVRRRELVDARKMVSYFLREQGWTYKSIGQVMGRDHATAVHHVRTVCWFLETDDKMKRQYLNFVSA